MTNRNDNYRIHAVKRDGTVVKGTCHDDGLASLLCVRQDDGTTAYVSVLDRVVERVQIGQSGAYAIAADERW